MSKPQSAAEFRPEVPGLAYFTPEARKAPEPAKPAQDAHRAALEQMFDYFQ